MIRSGKIVMLLIVCFGALWCSGCSTVRTYAVGSVIQDVAEASQAQSNITLIREGTPAYLMLIDGLIHSNPQNQRLLIAGAKAYLFYAMTVDDRCQERMILAKAKTYAMRALRKNIRYAQCEDQPLSGYAQCIKDVFSRKHVPALYWAANCWGSWIAANLDSVGALAQLPRVELMMRRVLELDETYEYGGAHLFLGIYESSRPGGNLEKAEAHFQEALTISQGKVLMGYVYYAQYYAVRVHDHETFSSSLRTVLETPADRIPELTLQNTIAQNKAREILNREKDYFLD